MNKDELEFEKYFQKKLHEDQELIINTDYTEEQLREIYRLEYEWKRDAPDLHLKLEPQQLDYDTTRYYLPEVWEMSNGKLLYSDEELQNVLNLILYNLGIRKSLDVIPRKLVEQYLKITDDEGK